MKHIYALLIKFVMIAVILEIILNLLTYLTFTEILYLSITITILAYIIGDLLILRYSENIAATIADIGLSLITIYASNYFWYNAHLSFIDALIAAVVIGIGEWFFHKYLVNKVLEHKMEAD